MSSMTIQVGETHNICLFRVNNSGVGQSTSCSYKVFDNTDGAQVATGQLTHTQGAGGSLGFHRASWTPNNTVSKSYTVVVYDGTGANGATLDSYRLRVVTDVKDIQNTTDLADGRAIG